MIISRGRRYVFVHIPKTGGTALTLALEARAMKDDLILGDTPKARARKGRLKGISAAGRLWKHSTLADIDGLIPRDELAGFFCFTLVRNPWDRLVSYYHWLLDQSFDHPAVHLAKAHDFSTFLNRPETVAAQQNWPARAYMTDAAGNLRADLFVRLENLNAEIAPLQAHLGFSITPLAPHNASQRARDYRSYYSDTDAALISHICAPDIAQFGYSFDPIKF